MKITRKIKLIADPPEPEDKVCLEINSIKKHIFNFPIDLGETNNSVARMQKSEYFEAYLETNKILLKFNPNNCTFKHNKYTDLLILESDYEYRSWEIEVSLTKIPSKCKNDKKWTYSHINGSIELHINSFLFKCFRLFSRSFRLIKVFLMKCWMDYLLFCWFFYKINS